MRGSKRGASENVRAAALTQGGGYRTATPVMANVSSVATTHTRDLFVVPGSRCGSARLKNGWMRDAVAGVVVLPRTRSHWPTSLARGSYA
jgi:hypothetical protein